MLMKCRKKDKTLGLGFISSAFPAPIRGFKSLFLILPETLPLLPEPPQDRNPVDEQLKSSGGLFHPAEAGFRVLGFKVLGVFFRI